ncbi:hypothetical protein LDENG_00164810 [Lucifuga dentata]|nr:hypothetical protein LDENG_00164810 [Lucifuga dentata]
MKPNSLVFMFSGLTPDKRLPTQTFDDYQCSDSVETDFTELCTLLGVREIPAVSIKQPAPVLSETDGETMEDSETQMNTTPLSSKPCLLVELENEDSQSVMTVKVFGWKIDEQIARVLNKMLPYLSKLQSLYFWRAGLTEQMVISLQNTISLCSNLRSVTLEGNPLQEQVYHLLLSGDSLLSHLSLRNNRIGDEGAHVIGSALSTTRTTNMNLLSLNLAFNCIGDAGAAYIAQGLRLNRTLLFLSLSSNQIGDSGASHLAAILGQFALTHEEVVERRKLRLEREQSSSLVVDAEDAAVDRSPSAHSSPSQNISKGVKGIAKKKETLKKEEKSAAKKETSKTTKKYADQKAPHGKGSKLGSKEKQPSGLEQEEKAGTELSEQDELVEIVNPLPDEPVQHKDGQIILAGNTTLTSLNLAGNRITEKMLPLFLSSLQMQAEGGGLLRLCLQRNRFPPDCECYVKIQEVMVLRDPLNKTSSGQTEQEEQAAGT